MKLNLAGLLGAIGELPSVVNRGLLGPLPVNKTLGLDPMQVEEARNAALQDMAYGMLASPTRNQGLNVAMARGNARENFSGRMIDLLREQEFARMQSERDTTAARAAAARQANPRLANLTDEQVLANQAAQVDPSLDQRKAEFGYEVQRDEKLFERDDKRWNADYGLRLKNHALAQANSDRDYGLNMMRFALDQQRLNAEMERLNIPKVDEVEVRKRRESGLAASNMISLLVKLKTSIDQHGTETWPGPEKGRQGALYASVLSAFKQAKTMGTLDAGLLTLFEKMLSDPTAMTNAGANAFGALSGQLDALIEITGEEYAKDYQYLSKYGLAEGLIAPAEAARTGGLPSVSDIQKERLRREAARKAGEM